MDDDIAKLDLYGILEIPHDADEKQIVKGYRKKALKCHPDKNPDNPKAAEEFHQLTQALEVLTDVAAKAAYDKVIQAKKAAEIRHKQLDSKRKKLKEDLEAREAASERQGSAGINTKSLNAEIERLRKEGSKLVEEQQRRVREELAQQAQAQHHHGADIGARLKLKWKAKKDDESNGGYSQQVLHKLLDKYGDVVALILSTKKNGSAIVEFASQQAAVLAVRNEIGLSGNPLSFTWLSEKPADVHHDQLPPKTSNTARTTSEDTALFPPVSSSTGGGGVSGFSFQSQSGTGDTAAPAAGSGYDFEDMVMHRMRQAEERKQLAAQMAKDDDDAADAARHS